MQNTCGLGSRAGVGAVVPALLPSSANALRDLPSAPCCRSPS